jgi:predicted  nucleic acid-binding Zn-ribbon protein
MKKLILTTIALLIANTTIMASDNETKIEKQLDKNIERISMALDKFKAMKAAISNEDIDREATLRKVCSRMKRETKALNDSITHMDFQLELTQVSKKGKELKRTKDSIKDLRKQIEDLKKGLENDSMNTLKVAAR